MQLTSCFYRLSLWFSGRMAACVSCRERSKVKSLRVPVTPPLCAIRGFPRREEELGDVPALTQGLDARDGRLRPGTATLMFFNLHV